MEAAAVAAIEETDSDDNELDDDAEGCARLLEKLETINAAFDDTVLEVLLNLPPEVAVKIVATLEVTRERTTASLVAALLACEELTATTTSTTPGSTTTTLPNGAASCAELAAERASVNDAFDAAEAELTETIAGPDLVAAIASLEAARAEANAAYDTAMAACAAVTSTVPPASTTSTTAAIPAATCAEILAERAAFNAEIDAVEAKLNTVLAPALAQEVIAGVELQRAEANARFDAALASCSP